MTLPWKAILGGGLLGWVGAQALEVGISTPPDTVGRYERVEFELTAPTDYTNPFDPREVELDLEVTNPRGAPLAVPAFVYQPFERRSLSEGSRTVTWWYPVGSLRWAARFVPVEPGQYRVRAVLTDRRGTARSEVVTFECVTSDRRGHLTVSRDDPRFFATTDGAPFFPIGQNLAFIGEGQFMNLVRTEETLGRLAAQGANYIRVWAGCHDWAMGVEARKSAFGRSWDWQPPFAPHPDQPDRRCVRLQGQAGTSVRVNPSHRVALRPATRYRLSGRVRTEDGAQFEIRCGDHRLAPDAPSDAGDWARWNLEFTTGAAEHWLGETSMRLGEAGIAWVDSLSLVEAGGGPELLWEADPNRPVRGVYNQPDCFLLDEVLAAAERHGILIQLTLFTRDLYLNDLADESSEVYERAIDDAKKLLRYAVARWGCSTSLAVWEYFNEMDPGRPTTRFYCELGEHLDQIDPYRHLRSTSTWHPSPRDWKLPCLDFADEHFYLRPGDAQRLRDEVDAVLDRVALLRRHAPDRPVLLGEFGLANERWQPTNAMRQRPEVADFHNALWASALSGASGTALFWWWDRLDPRNHYPHYLPLAKFLSNIPWTTAGLHTARATVPLGPSSESPLAEPDPDVVVIGMAGQDRAHLWLFHTRASWQQTVVEGNPPKTVRGRHLEVFGLEDATYRVQWWHTREGRIIEESRPPSVGGFLEVPVPAFDRDLACHIIEAAPLTL